MKLRTKIILILGVSTLSVSFLIYAIISEILIRQFSTIENDSTIKHVERVLEASEIEKNQLQTLISDYASWDETYEYVQSKDPTYLEENFESNSFSKLKINLIVITNEKDEIVYKKSFDWYKNENVAFPSEFYVQAKAASLFEHSSPESSKSGLIKIPEGILEVTSHPIVTSNFEGPIRGTLIAGRYVDNSFAQRISSATKLKVALVDDVQPESFDQLLQSDGTEVLDNSAIINPADDKTMISYIKYLDLNQKPVLVLQAESPRFVNEVAKQSLNMLFFVVISISFFVTIGFLFLIDYLFLGRVLKLTSAVNSIKTDFQSVPNINLNGKDELSQLAFIIKKTFGRLLESRKALQETETRVALEKEKLDVILHSIGEGIFVLDTKKKIMLINKITSEITGYSEGDLIGAVYNDKLKFILERNRKENTKFIDDVFEKAKVSDLNDQTILLNKFGKEIPVAYSAAPIFDNQDNFAGCVVVFRDATKERLIERSKSEFVSVASHQLRTPLTAIKWIIELLLTGRAGKLNKDQKEYLEDISTSNQRMIELITDMLNVSRIEYNENFVLKKSSQNLHLLINKVLKDNQPNASKRKVNIKIDTKFPKSLNVSLDEEKIYQVLTNLISNAVKYSKKGGTVKIFAKKIDNRVNISVQDNGIGIPFEQQRRIFEKFFRADNAINQDPLGTGLGLYAARVIVEAHKGQLTYRSVQNEGTTFTVNLPI